MQEEKYCNAAGHYGGDPKPTGECPKCGKGWDLSYESLEKQLTELRAENERLKAEVEGVAGIKNRYRAFVENIEWHIRTNKPEGQKLNDCKGLLAVYKGIIQELETFITLTSPIQSQGENPAK